MLDLAMRTTDELLADIQRVHEAGVSLRRIAEEAGVPYGSLKQFRKDGYLGDEWREALDRWLDADPRAQLALQVDAVKRSSQRIADRSDAIRLLAGDLRQLAEILDEPDYTPQYKGGRFRDWVHHAAREMDSLMLLFDPRDDQR